MDWATRESLHRIIGSDTEDWQFLVRVLFIEVLCTLLIHGALQFLINYSAHLCFLKTLLEFLVEFKLGSK